MRGLDATLALLSDAADAFAWQTDVLARWIIEAELPQTKIAIGFDLHRLAQWTAQILARSRELAADIDERALRGGSAARAAEARLRAAAGGEGSNAALCNVLESTLRQAVDRALARPAVADEPTRELFSAIAADLARTPLHRPERGEIGLWPLGSPGQVAADLAGLRPGRSPRIFSGTEAPQPFHPGLDARRSAVAFLHQNLTELELPTMESCSRLLLQFRQLPWAFAVDMARQCWDEARHAQVFMQRLLELGGRVGEHACSHALWDMTADQPLAVRLAIHQRIGEWVGVDGALWNADRFRELGDEASAELLDFVARDEITHVAFGNRWIRWIHPDDAEVDAVVKQALERRRAFGKSAEGPPMFPFNRWACERAGFTSCEVQALEQAAQAKGSIFQRIGQARGA